MFVSFGYKLRGLGNVRVGLRRKGPDGCFFVFLYMMINAFIYLGWYLMLGSFWLMYGLCYLCFYLPLKGLMKLYKKKKTQDRHLDE